MRYDLTAGWTSVLDINLLTQGIAPTGTMAGMTAELVITDMDGVTIDTAGDVSIPDADVWSVRYSPDALDLVPGAYHLRVKVTDSDGKVCYFPSGAPDQLVVHREG